MEHKSFRTFHDAGLAAVAFFEQIQHSSEQVNASTSGFLAGVVSSLATTPGHTLHVSMECYMSTKNNLLHVFHEYGEPDVFRFETMGMFLDPVGHEVLVRNTVIGPNFVDIYYRRGTIAGPGVSSDRR